MNINEALGMITLEEIHKNCKTVLLGSLDQNIYRILKCKTHNVTIREITNDEATDFMREVLG